MGFFDFLGTTLSGGGESYSRAVSNELANYRERGMQPYDRSIKRDAAIRERVATDQLTKGVAANERQIASTAAAASRGPAIAMPSTSLNTAAVVNPPAQPMPTAPAPTPYNAGEFESWWAKQGTPTQSGAAPTKEAIPTGSKFLDSAMGMIEGNSSYDAGSALATLEKQRDDLKKALDAGYMVEGWPSGQVKVNTTRDPTIRRRAEEEIRQLETQIAGLKARGAPRTRGDQTSMPTNLQPTGDKPQVTGVPAQGPTFDEAMVAIKKFEGDLSMNPDDRGNWTGGKKGVGELKGTKYGISAASYPDLDIKNLTPEQAKQIYKRDFWDKIGADNLPGNVRLSVFDAAVNQGPKFATDTLAATGGDPAAFAAARKQRYADIAANDPSQQQFLDGWNNRAEAAASLTPVEALQQGGGNVGLNTQPYVEDPNRASLDLQITEFYQQQQQNMFDMVGAELAYAQENAADMARTMGASQYREYVNGLRRQQMEVSLAAMQSRITGATLYAYQGLNLAQGGKTGLLNLALTEITGVQTEIIPRTGQDGTPLFYSLAIAGQPVGEPMPYDQLVQEVRTRIDRGYAEALMSAQAETQSELTLRDFDRRAAIELAGWENYFGAQKGIEIEKARSEGQRRVEEAARAKGLQPTKESAPGGEAIFQDPNTGFLYQYVLRSEKVNGKTVDTPSFERIYY